MFEFVRTNFGLLACCVLGIDVEKNIGVYILTTIKKLAGIAFGIHLADQVALISVPLLASLVFDASAQVIGILVACQSLAHLFGSLPFGFLVDRIQLKTLVISATVISAVGFLGVAVNVLAGSLLGFGATVIFAGFGVVLYTLTALSIVPLSVSSKGLASANASIEIPRTLVSFVVPLLIGLFITDLIVNWIFFVGAAAAASAFIIALRMPTFKQIAPINDGVLFRLKEGGVFVIKNSFLRAISICAVFWNLAFTALLVVMVPLLTEFYFMDPGAFGIALSAFGLAAICGTWTAKQIGRSIAPNVLLMFGPGISAIAILILYLIPQGGSIFAICFAFFLLGYGPSIWLITQNSVRQLVTPAHMLGRVNAVIQTAIYGMRPIGALLGGAIVSMTSPRIGLIVVMVSFLLSFLAVLFSKLVSIKNYSELENN